VNDNGVSERGYDLVKVLSSATTDGLIPSDYLSTFPDDWMHRDLAELEIVLTSMFRKWGRDLNGGRTTPSITSPDIVIARKDFDLAGWLLEVERAGPETVQRRLRPAHPQYDRLRSMLSAYRGLAARGGWPAIPDDVVLKPLDRHEHVRALRANMTARGYNHVNTSSDPDLYDKELLKAVVHFQGRNGLEIDGVLGPKSFAALNMPAEERVNQIIVNMERWRWLPNNLGKRYVLVNQAGFRMRLVEKGRTVDTRRVIVGKAFHRSPMFSDKIQYLDFNPTWTVPRSIAGNEILPKLRRDPGYLAANNYKVYTSWKSDAPAMSPFTINWSDVSSRRFPYKSVQQPGPGNALGNVKFMFPNKFNVYLHDTPSRGLFARAERALSHGCIRVHRPLEFASLLFRNDQAGLDGKKIDNIVSSGKLTRVRLKTPVPVHLAYFTVWVDDDGIPAFFNDVYKRDDLVSRVFFGTV
ncbi:MAG: L,D-transpeptidase family protein, partial [Pseudomonadota bacterium]